LAARRRHGEKDERTEKNVVRKHGRKEQYFEKLFIYPSVIPKFHVLLQRNKK
jgi:hypothetical protein